MSQLGELTLQKAKPLAKLHFKYIELPLKFSNNVGMASHSWEL